jgi:hypothetical protein
MNETLAEPRATRRTSTRSIDGTEYRTTKEPGWACAALVGPTRTFNPLGADGTIRATITCIHTELRVLFRIASSLAAGCFVPAGPGGWALDPRLMLQQLGRERALCPSVQTARLSGSRDERMSSAEALAQFQRKRILDTCFQGRKLAYSARVQAAREPEEIPSQLQRPRSSGTLPRVLRSVLTPRVLRIVPSAAALVCVLWVFVAAHLTFFSPVAWPMNGKDEGYINAFAMRLLEGHFLPYVDGVSHRGPVLYWVAAIAAGLGDRMSFVPVRVLALCCSLLIVGLTFVAALRAKGPLAAGVAAVGIGVGCVLEQPPDDGLAYNGEPLLDVFAMAALVCLTVGLSSQGRRPSARWVAAAGCLAALAALSKQVGAVILAPFALWVVATAITHREGDTLLRRGRLVWAFVAGAAAPVLLVLGRYAVAGELGTFFFYFFTYNSHYYMAPYTQESFLREYRSWMLRYAAYVAAGIALVAFGITRCLSELDSKGFWALVHRRGFLLTVCLCAALSGAIANATLRNFPHYYVQAIPWFALLAGVLFEELAFAQSPSLKEWVLQVCALGPLVAIFLTMSLSKLADYRVAAARRPRNLNICQYVDQHSSPDDHIYVWGFAPDFYTFCKRRPGSRYVFSTFQSGYVPFFDNATRDQDRVRVVPGSPELFLGDLEASRPALVLDVPIAHRSIKDTPAFAAYLRKAYCAPTVYDGVEVFHRRREDGACPVPESR